MKNAIAGALVLLALIGCRPATVDAATGMQPSEQQTAGHSPEPKELPLRRGYYVNADTACGEASNATLALVRRDGISACGFERIEKIGEDRYRVRERCVEPGAGPDGGFELVQEYVVLATDRYRVTPEYGGSTEFRFCEQTSLPEWMHDNDISDVLE